MRTDGEKDELELAAQREASQMETRRRRRRNLVTIGLALGGVAAVGLLGLLSGRGGEEPTPDPLDLSRDAQRVCQEEFIPDRLKAPATAQYTDVEVQVSGTTYAVTGAVDSQNGFGALIRSRFTCVVASTGGNWRLVSAAVS